MVSSTEARGVLVGAARVPCFLLLQSRGAGLALRTGLRLRLLLLPLLGLRLADLRGDLHKSAQVQGGEPAMCAACLNPIHPWSAC